MLVGAVLTWSIASASAQVVTGEEEQPWPSIRGYNLAVGRMWISLVFLAGCGDPSYARYDPDVDVVILVKPTWEGSCGWYTHGPTADEAARELIDDGFTVYAAASCLWLTNCAGCSCGDRMVAVEVPVDNQPLLRDAGWYSPEENVRWCASSCIGPSDEEPRGYRVVGCPWHVVD